MNFRIFESVDELTSGAADAILDELRGDGPAVVALSGGSTPRPVYEILGSVGMDRIASRAITWVTGDERFVPPDHPDSNARMIQQTLFARGIPPAHQFLRFETENGDPASVAAAFEGRWRELGIERITLSILGLGSDGHTASLFPGTNALDAGGVATEVFVPRLDTWRVTLTLPVLREAATMFVVAAGEDKRAVIERVAAGEELPISRVLQGAGNAWWLVDRAAYPKIAEESK
ncbi:MAG: 6-phosphogluconolactonase [Acidobacteriota bacterium]